MTIEESIKILQSMKYDDDIECSENIALDMGIKALEKEPVLDKIRAEIMDIGNWSTKSELPNGYLIKVLEIIDKYKAESEVENES